MKKLMLCGMVATACMLSGVTLADDDCDGMGSAHHGMMMKSMGRHGMSGKVESVDHKTGWIKVKTEEGVLTVHFPPDSLKDVKEGETITIHLGFSKGERKDGGMMEEGGMMEDKTPK